MPNLFAGNSPTAFGSTSLILGRGLRKWRSRFRWRRIKRRYHGTLRAEMDHLEKMAQRRQTLLRQMTSLSRARQLLSIWHAVHIPIGMLLFFAAFVHIVGAVYYASLLR